MEPNNILQYIKSAKAN